MTPEHKKLINKLAAMATREHCSRENAYYACAKHPSSPFFARESSLCSCGADEHNAAVAAIAVELLAEIPALESGRIIRPRFPIAVNECGQWAIVADSLDSDRGKLEQSWDALETLSAPLEIVPVIHWATLTLPLPGGQPDIEAEVEG